MIDKNYIIQKWLSEMPNRLLCPMMIVEKDVFDFVIQVCPISYTFSKENPEINNVYSFGESYFRIRLKTT